MIKSVTVTNPKGESLTLELYNPEKSGLIIQNIEGLGPTKADINSTDLATTDGSFFNSARATSRNIVLTLAMMFDPLIEDARLRTYKFFPVKKRIRLVFETDRRLVEIYGYVESNTPNIFSKQETTQISIVCPDPYFYDARGLEESILSVEPLFEFPFSNESLTSPILEMGDIRIDRRAIINYEGDADAGMTILIHAMGESRNISLYNIDTHETMKINTDKIETITGLPYRATDDIIISTVKGQKSIQLLREGVYTNIISALSRDADWFQLSQGDNFFAYSAESGEDDLMITFSYRNAYGGI